MKIKKYWIGLCFVLALLAGIMPAPALRAQPAPSPIESRYLFIFDTSSAMKKCLPAETKTVTGLFVEGLNRQLHPGDSVGAWAFSRELQTGEFPLEYWYPGKMVEITSNLAAFAKSRHYSRTTRFNELMPLLNRVVSASPRLTVIIFCDGESQIAGTPWDAKINAIFKEHGRDMKKSRQPFIIILRSQFGQYVGSSINTPDSITIPSFPPVYQPPQVVTPPPPPPPSPPPLIIIGTHVGTNVPPAAPPVTPPPAIPAPAPANPVPPPSVAPPPANPVPENHAPQTNVAPPVAISTPPTNPVAATLETLPPPAPVPAVAAVPATPSMPAGETPQTSGEGKNRVLAVVVVVAVLLGVLFFLLFRPRHRASPSLITESLKKK